MLGTILCQPTRKNAKHPLLKEEERILESLKDLNKRKQISDELLEDLRPTGSQPARLYGTAKVHKANVPLRPVLSMPGSCYHKIGKQIADWLSVVTECGINTSSKSISSQLKNITLEPDEVIVSFDICSLYTNVPTEDAIKHCAKLLYSGRYPKPPVRKKTFFELAKLCNCNVIMLTHKGYYKQKDELAIGSPPDPQKHQIQ